MTALNSLTLNRVLSDDAWDRWLAILRVPLEGALCCLCPLAPLLPPEFQTGTCFFEFDSKAPAPDPGVEIRRGGVFRSEERKV